MKLQTVLFAAILNLVFGHAVGARQDTGAGPAERPFRDPPRLTSQLPDGFGLSDLERLAASPLQGVHVAAGTLELAANSKLELPVSPTDWLEISFSVDSAAWSATGGAELTVLLETDGGDRRELELIQRREGEGTLSAVAVRSVPESGSVAADWAPSRTEWSGPLPSGPWRVIFRHGLCELISPVRERSVACMASGPAGRVAGFSLRTGAAATRLDGFSVSWSESPDPGWSPVQIAELDRAHELNLEVFRLWQKSRFQEALEGAGKALSVFSSIHGEYHARTALTLTQIAAQHRDLGDPAESWRFSERALNIRRAIFGDRHPFVLSQTRELVGELLDSGQREEAQRMLESRNRALAEAYGTESVFHAIALLNQSVLLERFGEYHLAIGQIQAALDILERVEGPEGTNARTARSNLAGMLAMVGRYGEALDLQAAILGELKQRSDTKPRDLAILLHNHARTLQSVGDTDRARKCFEESLEHWKQSGPADGMLRASTLDNLGALLIRIEKPDEAERLLGEAADYFESSGATNCREYGNVLANQARLLIAREDHAAARQKVERVLQVYRTALGESHPDYSFARSLLATVEAGEKNHEAAIRIWKETVPFFDGCYGPGNMHSTLVHRQIAACLWYQPELATPHFHLALDGIQRQIQLASLAQSESLQLRYLSDLRGTLDLYFSLVLSGNLPVDFAVEKLLQSRGFVELRQKQWRGLQESEETRQALGELRRLAAEISGLSLQPAGAGPGSAEADHLRAILLRRGELEARLAGQGEPGESAFHFPTLAEIQGSLPDDAALVAFLEFDRYQATGEGETAWPFERRCLAAVIRPQAAVKLVDLGPAAEIHRLVSLWRRDLGHSPTARGAGKSLRELVWNPLLPSLENADLVLLAPDGELNRLPFHALPGDAPDSFLIESHRLSLLPVPMLLPKMLRSSRGASEGILLTVSQVDYGQEQPASAAAEPVTGGGRLGLDDIRRSTRGGGWASLDLQTGYEADAVEKSFRGYLAAGDRSPRIESLRGSAASESGFIARAPNFRFLHLATHGFFAPPELTEGTGAGRQEAPGGSGESSVLTKLALFQKSHQELPPGQLCGLVFAGANQTARPPSDDGFLTADEIAFLPLKDCEMAVLSACETGLGRVAAGEGVLGLQRAFHVAGARTVVASLWKVDDRSTSELMQLFYAGLLAEDGAVRAPTRLDALRRAQLKLLEQFRRQRGLDNAPQPASENLPPKFWAGFVMSGDWR